MKVEFRYKKKSSEYECFLIFFLFGGIIKHRIDLSSSFNNLSEKLFNGFILNRRILNEDIGKIKNAIQCDICSIFLKIGSKDPGVTGLLYGLLWSSVPFTLQHIKRLIPINKEFINIEADFSRPILNIDVYLSCRIRFLTMITYFKKLDFMRGDKV